MRCEPPQSPAPGAIDIPALREKYRQERDKRIILEATNQYVRTTGGFAEAAGDDEAYEGDPHMSVVPRAPLLEDLDVAILGAGRTGIPAGYHLKQAGDSTFRETHQAGVFGGVWYGDPSPG